MRRASMRLQAQDEKLLSTRRRKPNRRLRQQRADEITAPKDARRMRPFIYGEQR